MKQNNYTVHDIERYHRGKMTPAERHALEKAALDDPFLADALEGYGHAPAAASDLISLQQKLQARIGKEEDNKKVFFIGSNWMRIAALFILFAGGGWLVFQIFTGKKQEIATSQTMEKQQPVETVTNSRDSAPVYSDAPNTNTPLIQSLPATEKKSFEVKQNTPPGNGNDLVTMQPPQQNAPVQPSIIPETTFDSLQTMAKIRFEKSVAEKDGYTDSVLARSNRYNEEESRKKKSENVLARSNPSFTNKEVSRQVRAVKPDTIKNFDVVLQSSPMALDEVVVVNKNKTVARHDARRRMQITVDTLEPAEGWTNFGDYIATNMRAPEELEAKPVKGEVELSFEVNQKGEPVNITIVRSLCEKCDEEAVRLLKDGPRWKNNKKRGTVRFSF